MNVARLAAPPLLAWVSAVGGIALWPWLRQLPGFWLPMLAPMFAVFWAPLLIGITAALLVGEFESKPTLKNFVIVQAEVVLVFAAEFWAMSLFWNVESYWK